MVAAKALVGRADDLVGTEQFLNAVSAPARHTCHGKQRGVQLHGDAQHIVDKAAVEVHVGADALEDPALFRDQLRGHHFDLVVEGQVFVPAFFVGQLLHIALEHHLAGVAEGVDCVAHAVDQALAVKGLAVQQFFQVGFQFLVVLGVVQIFADVLHHLHHHQVGAAVARALEGAQRCRHGRIGIGAGGCDHTGGKGGVVAAAVLCMQQQGHIQHPRFQFGVLHIRAQHPQEVLCGGKLGVRTVDVHASVLFVVVVGVVAVHGQHGENARQLDALAQHIGDLQIVGHGVVGGQREHAAGHGVHDIMAGGLHDDIPGKVCGHGAALAQHPAELLQLFLRGQFAEQQQIGRLFKGETAAGRSPDQVLDIIAAVKQLAVRRLFYAVHILKGADIGNIRQTRQHALAVFVAQARLDAKFPVEIFGDAVMLGTQRLLLVEISHHVLQMIHRCVAPFLLPSCPKKPY